MPNRYPLWKNILVVLILAMGVIYAVPNLYHPDPAIQITGESGGTEMTPVMQEQAVAALQQAQIDIKATEFSKGSILIRLVSREQQLAAKDAVEKALGGDFIVALNLASTTPAWLTSIGAKPMKLGLDLAGGVHFLLEVDTSTMLAKKVEAVAADLRRELRDANLPSRQWSVKQDGKTVVLRFPDEANRSAAMTAVRKVAGDMTRTTSEKDGQFLVSLTLSEQALNELEGYAVSQNVVALRNRVNALGVAEPLVQKQGRNRIVVELPGVQDAAQAKRIIGKTANLEFRLVANAETPPSQREKFSFRNEPSREVELEESVIVTGDQVTSANNQVDPETGTQQVNITLDSSGGQKMNRATRNNIGRPMGVLFIETKAESSRQRNADGTETIVHTPKTEKSLINVATIQSALGVQFRITGLDSQAEAHELALLLRAGALAAPVYIIEERTIGPSLGAANISRGFHSTLWGFAAIAVFMIIYYQMFGVVSVTALASNLVLLVAALAALQATLSLPGIAAIALTLGMAIDANVLINERIREELRGGANPQAAIMAGYDRAFSTIVDSNVTTFIAGLMLLLFGTGPVRGFAVVHCLGILTSIVSSVFISRALVNWIYGSRRQLASLSIGQVWKAGITVAHR
ncbi:MAG TPA: protein translocase subunit SecD [Pseudomonadales bacterium]|jgi:preprotein translocase subunit SecD|nr:protein translocase subunit SecD [Cellvibrionales bacterium]HRF87954.1 protein translocase subunit SecD [Pseudomonadales bacterium]HRG50755.1 protein translocase subunit SecD [Pseudomonadales bacterium]